MKKSIGIIGCGLMGISIALKLKREGYAVTILEADSNIGGLASAWKIGEYSWDKFYHVILPGDNYTLDLLDLIDLKEKINWVETKTGFFIDNSYSSMSNTLEYIKFPALNLIDKFRMGLTILIGSHLKNYKELETIPVIDWLTKWSGKKVFKKIWLPLLKAKLGDGYKKTSAAFICATLKRLYGARQKGSKKEVFGYVRGGYARIFNDLLKKIKSSDIELVTNFKIEKVFSDEPGKVLIQGENNRTMDFDYAISTLPSYLTSKIAIGLSETEKDKLFKINYLGVVCVSLLLRKTLTPFYVTNIADDNILLTGVIEMTALVDKNYFDGNSLIYLPKYIDSFDPMFDMSDEDIKNEFIINLKKMQPDLSDKDIITSQVAKARFVITLPEMEYSKKLPAYKTSIPNFFIINSSFITDGTLNVNETLKVAETYLPKVIKIIKDNE